MFHFPNKVDWTRFFRFDKLWIENLNWAVISPAAKAVFPVIACHCNEYGQSFPGEEVISALSGLTAKSVRKGIHHLEGFPGFDWSYYVTKRGKRGKRFVIEFPPKGTKGRIFFFYRGIIDGGIWRKLKPTAQALYPVMRHFSYYERDEDDESTEFIDIYMNRSWELCNAEIEQLANLAGINRRSIAGAMQSLQHNFLIEVYTDANGEKIWKIYLTPQKFWKASYLNQQLKTAVIPSNVGK